MTPSRLSRDASPTEAARGDRLLVTALLLTLILWNIPYGSYALYPFKLLATWFHETSHGLAMLVTGAGLDRLLIYRDTSGLAVPERGVSLAAQAFISSAGYMGTAFLGAVLLVLGRTARLSRWVLGGIGAVMVLTAVVFVANAFGVVTVAGFGILLGLLALFGGERTRGFVLNLVAAQSCINAVLDIRVLFAANMYVNGQPHQSSDAHAVARMLGGPAWLWASMWMIWSFALFYLALRKVRWRPRAAEPIVLPLPAK